MDIATKAASGFMAILYLTLLLHGHIQSPDQIPGGVDLNEMGYLAGAIECENGSNSVKCRLLTGSVVLNRVASPNWHGNNVEEVIMARDGGFIQYATPTRNNFKTKKCSELTKAIAKYLLIFGPVCPNNVMYQGQNKYAGSGVFDYCDTPDGKEWFCYE